MKVIKSNWFLICSVALLVLAAFLRFYNYDNRWVLAYDQAHDAIIAQYALSHLKLPLLGPFSSAGPFQTGGEWYWFIMAGTLIFSPLTINGPWIFLTITQILFIWMIIYTGSKLGGKILGLLAGIFAAVSPAAIAQSVNLTNQSPINIFSLLAILSIVLYSQEKKGWQVLLLGLSVSIAISIHLQGAALIFLIIVSLVILPVKNIKHIFLLVLGGILPFLPLLIIDIQNHFFNTKGFLQYFLYDQYKIPLDQLGRNWHTYVMFFWPTALGNIIGGNKIFGILSAIIMVCGAIFAVLTKKLSRLWLILLLSMLCFFVMLRYLHTPLFDSYLMFFHPFIFLLIAFAISLILTKNKVIGIVFLFLLLSGSVYKDIQDIQGATNYTRERSAYWSKFLNQKFPNKKFIIYDYRNRSNSYTYPLIFFLGRENKLDEKGYKIGFDLPFQKDDLVNYNVFTQIKGNKMGFVFVDLESSSSAQLEKAKWYTAYPQLIYESTEQWYKKKGL